MFILEPIPQLTEAVTLPQLEALITSSRIAVFDHGVFFYFQTEEETQKYAELVKRYMTKKPKTVLTATKSKSSDYFYFQLTKTEYDSLSQQYSNEKSLTPKDNKTFFIKNIGGSPDRNFFEEFRDMITPLPGGKKNVVLRPLEKKRFTTRGRQVIERDKKEPQFTAEEKQWFSKKTSMSLVTPAATPPLFRFNDDKTNKQIALIFHEKDVLINQCFTRAMSTYSRPADKDKREESQAYINKYWQFIFGADELEEFKQAIAMPQNQNITNEVLARIRFNPDGTSKIAINNNNYESRWLAQAYAESLAKRLQYQYEKLGLRIEANLQIPICFYAPGLPSHMCPYNVFAQAIDRAKAYSSYQSTIVRRERYANHHYEFLLVLSPDEIKAALQEPIGQLRVPLFFDMLRQGYSHIVNLLWEKINEDAAFLDGLVITLKTRRHEIMLFDSLSKALYHAVRKNNTSITIALLKAGASLSYQNPITDNTTLHLAAQHGNIEMVNALLKAKANPAAKRKDGKSPIVLAAEAGHWICVEAIIRYKGSALSQDHAIVLALAIKANQTALVSLLAAKTGVVDRITGNTLLHWAAQHENKDMFCVLLRAGADLRIQNKAHETPVGLLHAKNRLNFILEIAESCQQPEAQSAIRSEALVYAARDKQTEIVIKLINAGANPAAKRKDGKSPVVLAAEADHWICVKTMIQHYKGDALNEDYATVLALAAKASQTAVVSLLAERCIKTDIVDPATGNTPLHWAAQYGNTEIMYVLLNAGANTAAKRKDGKSPVVLAAEAGHWICVEATIQRYPKDSPQQPDDYKTIFSTAIKANKVSIVLAIMQNSDHGFLKDLVLRQSFKELKQNEQAGCLIRLCQDFFRFMDSYKPNNKYRLEKLGELWTFMSKTLRELTADNLKDTLVKIEQKFSAMKKLVEEDHRDNATFKDFNTLFFKFTGHMMTQSRMGRKLGHLETAAHNCLIVSTA